MLRLKSICPQLQQKLGRDFCYHVFCPTPQNNFPQEMRNLILLSERHIFTHKQNEINTKNTNQLTACCTTYSQNRFQVLSCGTIYYETKKVYKLPAASTPYTHAFFVEEFEYLIVANVDGSLYNVVESGPETVSNSVGQIDGGILAMSMSPDADIFVIYTANNSILTLTSDLQPLHEFPAHSPVQKNTSVQIKWRGDGGSYIITTVDSDVVEERKIRVYDREGVLKSVCRSVDGTLCAKMHPEISWSTDGSLITAVQTIRDKLQVIFFEPNGLRHRDFKLRNVTPKSHQVKAIDWNSDSNLLAIVLNSSSITSPSSNSLLQIYHRNNYHWYLKFELKSLTYDPIITASFDAERPYRLTVNSNKLTASVYDFCWDINVNGDGTKNCEACVIDGGGINLTRLGEELIPPPMSSEVFSLDKNVSVHFNAVSFFPSSGCFAALTSDNYIYCFNNGDHVIRSHTNKNRGSKVENEPHLNLRQLVCLKNAEGECSVLTVATDRLNGEERLAEFSIDGSDEVTFTELPQSCDDSFEIRVLRICNDLEADKAVVEMGDGSLLIYTGMVCSNNGTQSLVPLFLQMLEPCPWLAVLRGSDGEGGYTVIGLSARNRLYCGDQLVCASSSSFTYSRKQSVLIYVTLGSRAQLRFQHADVLLNWDPLAGSEDMMEYYARENGYEPRNVERGSKIVACVCNEPLVVLQLPRGNLENVYPRALTLELCRKLLAGRKYRDCFKLMRKQRIDFNLIVDHDPILFLENVRRFLRKIKNVDYLNLFISHLQDVDFTAVKYIAPAYHRGGGEGGSVDKTSSAFKLSCNFNFEDKVNTVCKAMRLSMLETEEGVEFFLLPILSTFAKQKPPKLEEALSLIVSESELRKHSLTSQFCQDSIKYLAFLASYDVLFDTALGMYDWELAKCVARNSQKDPRVYLNMLDKLKNLPELTAKYRVDMSLQRWDKALKSLFLAAASFDGTDEEIDQKERSNKLALSLVTAHSLEKLALSLYSSGSMKRECTLILARRMYKERSFGKAVTLYLSCDPPAVSEAISAAVRCGDWRAIFSCCEPTEWEALGEEMVEILTGEGSDGGSLRSGKMDAARIKTDYCNNDYNGAIKVLNSGCYWLEAARLAKLNSTSVASIRNAAKVYAVESCLELEERGTGLRKIFKRYVEVVEIRKKAHEEEEENFARGGGEGGACNNGDEESTFSVGTGMSGVSGLSGMSGTSVGSTYSINSGYSGQSGKNGFSMNCSDVGGKSNVTTKDKKNAKEAKKIKEKARRKRRAEGKKMRPGSKEELDQLVVTIKGFAVGTEELEIVEETICFLVRGGAITEAVELYCAMEVFERLWEEELKCNEITVETVHVNETVNNNNYNNYNNNNNNNKDSKEFLFSAKLHNKTTSLMEVFI